MISELIVLEGDTVAGGVITALQQWGKINSIPISCVGDPVATHGAYPDEHIAAVIAQGSPWMSIGGKQVTFNTALASCGDSATAMLQQWAKIPG